MMHSIAVLFQIALVAPACATERSNERASSVLQLIDRQLSSWPVQRVGLDNTMLKKPKKKPRFPIKAICKCAPNGKPCQTGSDTGNECTGTITLTQLNEQDIEIVYEVKGLKPGKHGFHVHEKADFSNGCASAGPHYNPFQKLHGDIRDQERHVGDLGNIVADRNGVAKGSVTDHLVKLFGDTSVVGRALMIHADEDDLGRGDNSKFGENPPPNGFVSKATGNAGARIACGEIKLCECTSA
eukprot:gnl/MRDRNA2_/MRDRNA2_59188_c0_seq1.p1 gnl/MRDRNA2_/MRDRNA2_59188_c0~~gnl/MRDRNA2_/MRDRNA2_59188_c0_seq1.p1  ORF type:complete len:241 (-),score=38.54 gnl/MRDRNA2_/MRDRNA2_59188_c0_seq1:164-886(-)